MNPVCWFEIYVDDMSRAKAFYQTVLNIELQDLQPPGGGPEMQMMAFPSSMDQYGATGALVKMAGCEVGGYSTIVYFSCEDCAVEGSRIVAAGGSIHREKLSIGEHGFIVLGVDTEGNMFGLHSMK
ncbi:VOC family protein [Vibrio gangliei]|uniref:VOC family protein n=1 Tax=Vibrio gangliei TaxID=2077090 RepID=UPI000D015D44|nr:VOC family protein [Vibrio gangliei]